MKFRLTKISCRNEKSKKSSFPVGYWIEGYTSDLPEAGKVISIGAGLNTCNGNKEGWSWFHTSRIESINPLSTVPYICDVHTLNSTWRFEVLHVSSEEVNL
jgi:hypothetical protein